MNARRLAPLAAALTIALPACRKERAPARPDAGPARASGFTMADLVAATALDARVARLTLLASEYKTALTFDRGTRLLAHTDELAPKLDQASAEAGRALEAIAHPGDRALAAPVVAAAQRWPALLRAARDELLGPPNVDRARAAEALAAADAEVARALSAYRRFRASWRIADAPGEDAAVMAFLLSRRTLESAETELGSALPEGPGTSADGGRPDFAFARRRVDGALREARAAAGRVDAARRPSAVAWVDAQGKALDAMLSMGAGAAAPEEYARLGLVYQGAKVESREAAAAYTRATAARIP